jgi:RNA polymerase sigma factor (sigma-70 family)
MGIKPKPEFDEVYKYAKKSIDFFITKKATHLPAEFQDEIRQDAFERVWKAYADLDPDKGWRSFIQLHCRGAMKDYIKGCKGSVDSEVGLERIEIKDNDGTDLSTENILGLLGHYHLQDKKIETFQPNWELLSRLIVLDEDLHIICKVLIGLSQDEIANQMLTFNKKGISRERVSQRAYEFFDRADAVANIGDPRTDQMIFALGLCKKYFMPEKDNGYGWELPSFNIYDPDSFRLVRAHLAEQERIADNQLCFDLDAAM